jgi:ribosomal protein S18 acetylase RimI-like enzyme
MGQIRQEDIIVHNNRWWFGTTQNIIYKGGLAIAEIIYDNTTPDTAYIRRLAVHDSVRHQGIGTSMLKLCEQMIRDNGKRLVHLHADKEDPDLVMWYSNNGYTILDTEDHEHLMGKSL